MNKLKLNPKISIKIAIFYILVMGIGMYIMKSVFGYNYSDPKMVFVIGWVEILLSLIAIFAVVKFSSWKQVGFGKMRTKHLLWMVPGALSMLILLLQIFAKINTNGVNTPQLTLLIATGLTTLLVGFSEELMFRGILLRGLLVNKGIYTSMFVSAVFFALLHSVNVFGGLEFQVMTNQLIFAFMYGLLMAPIALKLRSLIPLIIYHFLWDFSLLSAPIVFASVPLMMFFLPIVEILFIIILWVLMRKETPESIKISK